MMKDEDSVRLLNDEMLCQVGPDIAGVTRLSEAAVRNYARFRVGGRCMLWLCSAGEQRGASHDFSSPVLAVATGLDLAHVCQSPFFLCI